MLNDFDPHLYNEDFKTLKPGMVLIPKPRTAMLFPWKLRVMTDFEAQKQCGWHEEDWGWKTDRNLPRAPDEYVYFEKDAVLMYLGGVDPAMPGHGYKAFKFLVGEKVGWWFSWVNLSIFEHLEIVISGEENAQGR